MQQLSRNRCMRDIHGGYRAVTGGPRLTIGTDGHYRYGGSPIILRGVCFGSETYYRPGDAAIAQAMGCNVIRFTTRMWAPNNPPDGDFKGDAYDPSSPISGFLNVPYFNRICDGVREAKSLGMVTRLSFDSDCGQFERSDTNCQIGGSPSTFWLPSGAQRLANHLNAIRTYARTLRGHLDQMEPFVEPHPIVTYPYGQGLLYDPRDVILLQERAMQIALGEDPQMMFAIGGQSYQRTELGYPSFIGVPEWIARRNVGGTADLLDGGVTNTLAGVQNAVRKATDFRAGYRIPVDFNQVGARTENDPGYAFEDQVYGVLADPSDGGGSVSFMKWNFVGALDQHYSPFQQVDMNDMGARVVDSARVTSMTNGFALPRLYS